MKKIRVSEATDSVLDWMVAKALGLAYRNDEKYGPMCFRTPVTKGVVIWGPYPLPYSTDWSQGGPIIEREEIELHVLASGLDVSAHPTFKPGDTWEANLWPADLDIIQICGPTPLIAAMRCYVASKLGDEVDVS